MTSGAPRGEWKRLVDLLLRLGIVERGDLLRAVSAAKQSGTHLTRVLVDQGLVDEDRLTRALASALGIESVTPSTMKIHERVLGLIPARVALRSRALPIAIKRANQTDYLYVALGDPLDTDAIEEIQQTTGCRVSVLVAPPSQLDAALARFYGSGSDRPLSSSPPGESGERTSAAPAVVQPSSPASTGFIGSLGTAVGPVPASATSPGVSTPPPGRATTGAARGLPGLPEGYVVATPRPPVPGSAGLPPPVSPSNQGLPRPSASAPPKPRAQLPAAAAATGGAPTTPRGTPVATRAPLPAFPSSADLKTVPLAAGRMTREAEEARTQLDTSLFDLIPGAPSSSALDAVSTEHVRPSAPSDARPSRSQLETARPTESARRDTALHILTDLPAVGLPSPTPSASPPERGWDLDIEVDAPPPAPAPARATTMVEDHPVELDEVVEEEVDLGSGAADGAVRSEPQSSSRALGFGLAQPLALASRETVDDPDEATSQLDLDAERVARFGGEGSREPVAPLRVLARTMELPVAPREAPSPFDAMRGASLNPGLEKTGIIPALQWELEAFEPAPTVARPSPHLAGTDDIPSSPHEVLARLESEDPLPPDVPVPLDEDIPIHDDGEASVESNPALLEETIGPTTDPRQEAAAEAVLLDGDALEPGLVVTGRRSEPAPSAAAMVLEAAGVERARDPDLRARDVEPVRAVPLSREAQPTLESPEPVPTASHADGPLDLEASKLVDALIAGDTLTSAERAQLVLALARALLQSGALSREALVRALASF